MAARPRKYPDMEKPLNRVAPSKRGYKQVYLKAEPPGASPYDRLDAYRRRHGLVSMQDAILHMLDRLEPPAE